MKQWSLHHFIPARTQQPQTSLHQGILFPIFSNFIQFSIISLGFPFPLCTPQSKGARIFSSSTSPFSPQHHPHAAPTCLSPFFAAKSLCKLPSPQDDSQGFTGGSNCILAAARFFHVKSLIVIYSCFSSFSSPCIIPYLQLLPI